MDYGQFCTSVRKPYISLEILVFSNIYKSLTIDPFNIKLWNFAIYSVVFRFISVLCRNYKNKETCTQALSVWNPAMNE